MECNRLADFEKQYNTISHPVPTMGEIAKILSDEHVSDDVGVALTSALVQLAKAEYETTDLYFSRSGEGDYYYVDTERPKPLSG